MWSSMASSSPDRTLHPQKLPLRNCSSSYDGQLFSQNYYINFHGITNIDNSRLNNHIDAMARQQTGSGCWRKLAAVGEPRPEIHRLRAHRQPQHPSPAISSILIWQQNAATPCPHPSIFFTHSASYSVNSPSLSFAFTGFLLIYLATRNM